MPELQIKRVVFVSPHQPAGSTDRGCGGIGRLAQSTPGGVIWWRRSVHRMYDVQSSSAQRGGGQPAYGARYGTIAGYV